MFDLKNNIGSVLREVSFKVENNITAIMEQYGYNVNERLFQAMNYSIFGKNPRIRAFLTLSCCEIFEVNETASLNLASCVELIHTYALIHDDLPSMDNDNYRRGQETCHIKFDQATAILAGDSLQSLAFEVLSSKSGNLDSSIRCELIKYLARSIGMNGMAGGQMIENLHKKSNFTVDGLTRMNRMKIGELFSFCCEAGAIVSNSPRNFRLALRGYALSVSLALQIINDIQENPVKANDTDLPQDFGSSNNNYLSIIDREQANYQAELLVDQAKAHLSIIGTRAKLLKDFADYILLK